MSGLSFTDRRSFMINTRHILIAMLLAGSAGAGAQTQPAATPPPPPAPAPESVGNPQLRDFELPGARTVPAPPVEQPAPPPVRAEPAPAPPPAITPPASRPPAASTPAPAAPRPAPAAPRPATPAADVPSAPAPVPAPVAAEPAPVRDETPPLPQVSAPLPAPDTVPVPAEPADPGAAALEPVDGGTNWLWLLALAGAGLLGLLAYRKFRRRDEEVLEAQPVHAEPAPEPVMAPPPPAPAAAAAVTRPTPAAPAAAPAAAGGVVGIQVRPWLELEFKPDRAAATLTDASVQYELVIRNKGNAPARNIRIEQRMFNAGAEQEREIDAFYAEPVRERTPPSVAVIPARGEMRLRNSVSMPNQSVREITVQGRRLFIPTVAFNVIYDYGDRRSGQTSMSYVVGREAETPSEKMGAFRLDLGPRLYRSVGQRQTKLARIV